MSEKLIGRVVAVENIYYDGLNDTFALVWNEEAATVEYGGPCNYHQVCDGPAWVIAFYTIAKAIERQACEARKAADAAQAKAEAEAVRPARGKVVEVVRGRKIKKGTMATVFWIGESRWGWRVGLEMADGTREFTDAGNIEVVEGPALPLVGNADRKAA